MAFIRDTTSQALGNTVIHPFHEGEPDSHHYGSLATAVGLAPIVCRGLPQHLIRLFDRGSTPQQSRASLRADY